MRGCFSPPSPESRTGPQWSWIRCLIIPGRTNSDVSLEPNKLVARTCPRLAERPLGSTARHGCLFSTEPPRGVTSAAPHLCLANLHLLRNRDGFSAETFQLWKGMLPLKFPQDRPKTHSLPPEVFYLHILTSLTARDSHSLGCANCKTRSLGCWASSAPAGLTDEAPKS